jgi:hypothetical protein
MLLPTWRFPKMPYTVILRSVLGLVSETLWLPEAEASFDFWSDGATGWSLMNGDSLLGPVEWPNTRRGRLATLVPHQARQAAAALELRHRNARSISSSVELCPTNAPRRAVKSSPLWWSSPAGTRASIRSCVGQRSSTSGMTWPSAYASRNTWLEVARVLGLDVDRG